MKDLLTQNLNDVSTLIVELAQ